MSAIVMNLFKLGWNVTLALMDSVYMKEHDETEWNNNISAHTFTHKHKYTHAQPVNHYCHTL